MESIIKNLGLKETKIAQGISFIVDCKFWETNHPCIYITDYNLEWDDEYHWTDESHFNEANLLKSKGFVTIFYKDKRVFFKLVVDKETMTNKISAIKFVDRFIHILNHEGVI